MNWLINLISTHLLFDNFLKTIKINYVLIEKFLFFIFLAHIDLYLSLIELIDLIWLTKIKEISVKMRIFYTYQTTLNLEC